MTTYSPSMRFWEGTPGDPAVKNVWGTALDTNFTLIDNGFNNNSPISLTGLTAYTLTVANGAPDQARQAVLPFIGILSGGCTVTLPNVQRVGWAINNTTGGFSVTLSAGAGTSGVIPPDGLWHLYSCDGSGNVVLAGLVSAASGGLSGTTLTVSGNATIGGTTVLSGQTTVNNALLMNSGQCFGGFFTAGLNASGATVSGALNAGSASVNGTLNVGGMTTLRGDVSMPVGGVAAVGISLSSSTYVFQVQQTNPSTTTTAYFANMSNTSSAFAFWQYNNTSIGSINITGGGTGVSYGSVSDGRLKTVERRITSVGSMIDKLRPVWFRWKARPDDEPEPGFVAQEVHKVWRWAITKGGRSKAWQMDPAKLVPLIVAELQDLRARVAELEAEVGNGV